MIDFFGRKAKAKAEAAQEELARLQLQYATMLKDELDKNRELSNRVEYLVRTIRDMDDAIFRMGQMTSWDQQRPVFARLHDEMTARKVAESKRIGEILRPELTNTYATKPKRLPRG